MAKKEFNIEDSPAMRFVTNTDVFDKFAEASHTQDTPLNAAGASVTHENEKSEQSITLKLPKRQEPRKHSLTIKIPNSLYEKVKSRADDNNVSITEYVIQSLLLVLEKVDCH